MYVSCVQFFLLVGHDKCLTQHDGQEIRFRGTPVLRRAEFSRGVNDRLVVLKRSGRMRTVEGRSRSIIDAVYTRPVRHSLPFLVQDKKALECKEGESVHSLWFVGDDDGEPQVTDSSAGLYTPGKSIERRELSSGATLC